MPETTRDTVLTGWYVGYVVGAIVVALVVALVARLLTLVRQIGLEVRDITDALDDVREGTTSIPQVAVLNEHLASIVDRAGQARAVLSS